MMALLSLSRAVRSTGQRRIEMYRAGIPESRSKRAARHLSNTYLDGGVTALLPAPPLCHPHEMSEMSSEGALGFASDIKPLFRDSDRESMGWAFDLWSYEDVVAHGEEIAERLKDG